MLEAAPELADCLYSSVEFAKDRIKALFNYQLPTQDQNQVHNDLLTDAKKLLAEAQELLQETMIEVQIDATRARAERNGDSTLKGRLYFPKECCRAEFNDIMFNKCLTMAQKRHVIAYSRPSQY